MKAVRAIVKGRVQGVGFRWFTRDAARARGITGWVRNRSDGSVEAFLQGADDAVQAVLTSLATGPGHSRVDELTTSDAATDPDITSFEIRPAA